MSEILMRVAVRLLDEAWQRDRPADYYVPRGGQSTQPGKYEYWRARLAEWEPPVVSLGTTPASVCFTDGRHRFAAARDAGQETVTVWVPVEEVDEFRRLVRGVALTPLPAPTRCAYC